MIMAVMVTPDVVQYRKTLQDWQKITFNGKGHCILIGKCLKGGVACHNINKTCKEYVPVETFGMLG